MTPVDIDKLKELQSLLSDGEWWQTVTRGPNPTSFTSDMTHVARQAAALIAKAERVDAVAKVLTEAAEWFEQYATEHYAKAKTAPDYREQHGREVRGKTNADRARHLRNALSPKQPCENCGCSDPSHAVVPKMREVIINCALCHAKAGCGCALSPKESE